MRVLDTPDILFGELFDAVQRSGIFEDSKTFADAIPKRPVKDILSDYRMDKNKSDFDLNTFVGDNFEIPQINSVEITHKKNITAHIESLWDLLTRKDTDEIISGSLLPLPYPYIVPGGRFREIYYWDSYFTMLGLARSGRWDMVRNMVKNFEHLINTYGHIPNGNRTYYLSRSQPPFFALMVEFLASHEGKESVYNEFSSALELEYQFWMYGDSGNSEEYGNRVVILDDKTRLNRYWDDNPVPRQESYTEDLHLCQNNKNSLSQMYRNIRAACESGWDFSSRWMQNPSDLATLMVSDIIPVDLNVLLYKLEKVLQHAMNYKGDYGKADFYADSAALRHQSIQKYFWNEEKGFYFDYNFMDKSHQDIYSLAACFPLWMGLSENFQAKSVAELLEKEFLKPGGLITTTIHSGQQWDSPNGWAPLQWVAVMGLEKYGFHNLANEIMSRWILIVEKVFSDTGKIMEKYNVEDMSLEAGGGEYPVQDGFGWTNGVYLDFWYQKSQKA